MLLAALQGGSSGFEWVKKKGEDAERWVGNKVKEIFGKGLEGLLRRGACFLITLSHEQLSRGPRSELDRARGNSGQTSSQIWLLPLYGSIIYTLSKLFFQVFSSYFVPSHAQIDSKHPYGTCVFYWYQLLVSVKRHYLTRLEKMLLFSSSLNSALLQKKLNRWLPYLTEGHVLLMRRFIKGHIWKKLFIKEAEAHLWLIVCL